MILWKSETFKTVSLPDEPERDFRIRLQQVAHERRDLEVERIKRQFSKKIDTLERQLKTAQRTVDKEGDQYQQKDARYSHFGWFLYLWCNSGWQNLANSRSHGRQDLPAV